MGDTASDMGDMASDMGDTGSDMGDTASDMGNVCVSDMFFGNFAIDQSFSNFGKF